MITIAITGGIGTGKSTVTEYLISKGYKVIDADKMAREMTEPGGKAMPYILENFGPEYICADGSMNRSAMRDLIYRNPQAKIKLEKGTTEVVVDDIETIKNEEEAKGTDLLFFDIPLLFELKKEKDYDKVWVVSSDLDIRKERIRDRDGITDSIIDLIIGSQSEEDYRRSKADEIIENNGSKEDLYKEIDKLIESQN